MKIAFMVEMEIEAVDEAGNRTVNREHVKNEETGQWEPTGAVLPDLLPEDIGQLGHLVAGALETPDGETGTVTEWLAGSNLFIRVIGTPKVTHISQDQEQPDRARPEA